MSATVIGQDPQVGTCYDQDEHGHYGSPVGIVAWVQNEQKVMLDGQYPVTVGDLGVSNCGHRTFAFSGSTRVNLAGRQPCRVGDSFAGTGVNPYVVYGTFSYSSSRVVLG